MRRSPLQAPDVWRVQSLHGFTPSDCPNPIYNGRLNPEYLKDASGFTGHAERLCVPSDEAELSVILRDAGASQTPVTIAGAGSGLTGGRVAKGGWVVSLEKFRALEIRSGSARVGAAITLLELRDAALPT